MAVEYDAAAEKNGHCVAILSSAHEKAARGRLVPMAGIITAAIRMKYVPALLLLAVLLIQLATGTVILNRSWTKRARRRDNPDFFWFMIGLQAVIATGYSVLVYLLVP